MEYPSRLSEYVQDYISSLDWGSVRDLTPEERAESKQTGKLIKMMVDALIASRETITGSKFKAFEQMVNSVPDLIKSELDERFTRDLIKGVPGYVERTMQLSRLDASRLPSKTTNSYLQEAVRTYIFGLPQASVALSRAALEQSLKENLGYQGTPTSIEMNTLLDEAEGAGVIDKTIRRLARKVANEANNVLHERPTSLAKTYEVLAMLRSVLQHLYD